MDKGAWQGTVHGVAELDVIEHTHTQQGHISRERAFCF